jgi:hypothetical protein
LRETSGHCATASDLSDRDTILFRVTQTIDVGTLPAGATSQYLQADGTYSYAYIQATSTYALGVTDRETGSLDIYMSREPRPE